MTELFDRLQRELPKRYSLEREIARGGMGTVYLAREHHPARQVAIKVLDPDITAQVGRERFLREIDLASKLTNPHIVPIFAAGDAGDLLYYVMPYMAGEPLSERIARERQLPIDDSLRITYDIADALEYAHQHKVVHRDIKPGNILLHGDHALVTDFGVARALSVAGSEPITETGVALGTPAYMSPEQATAETTVDGRADVYALGCVLYEMLAGEPPFHGRDARTILARQMVDPVPSLRAARDTVPVGVENVINRALSKSPTDRFKSAKQFARALAEASGDPRSSWNTPLPITAVTDARARKRRWARDASIAVIALLLAAVLWQPWRGPVESVTADSNRYTDSVAVMPLENLTGNPDNDYLGTGIAELVINRLSRIGPLKVISLHSAEALSASGLTTPQLADSLKVRHVVSGSLTMNQGVMRANVQHVNAETDATLWGDVFTTDMTDIFAAQEDIAQEVSSRLVDAIGGITAPADTSQTELGPGYEEYLLGGHWLSRRTADGIRRAIYWFNEALLLNPEDAASYADLSTTYTLSLTYRYDIGIDGYRAAGMALALAQRAISLDSTLAKAFAAHGYVKAVSNAPTQDVTQDFDRAVMLQPNAPSIPSWSARALAKAGRFEEAFAEAKRAVRLDPNSASRHIAVAYWALQLGDYNLAITEAQTASSLEPSLMLPRALQARALLLEGRADQCLQLVLGPHAGIRAICLSEVGQDSLAAAVVDSVVTEIESGVVADSVFTHVTRLEDLASYFAWIGDVPATISWIERAYQLSPSGIESMVLESALFDRVRQDPEFQRTVTRIRSGIWSRVEMEGRQAVTPQTSPSP
jgi:serine/threonine protein kinase/tetratricopeptide (TPR) repeat protein